MKNIIRHLLAIFIIILCFAVAFGAAAGVAWIVNVGLPALPEWFWPYMLRHAWIK